TAARQRGGRRGIRRVPESSRRAAPADAPLAPGHDAGAGRDALPDAGPRLRALRSERYREGQSTSLVAGIRAMHPEAGAALVLLGDQPEIRVDAIDAVLARWRSDGGDLVQAAYSGTAAHPMLFDRSMWPELEAATGDEG